MLAVVSSMFRLNVQKDSGYTDLVLDDFFKAYQVVHFILFIVS